MSETLHGLYENPETGTQQSVYDLAIGARHARLEKNPDAGPDDAVRLNGDPYVPVDEPSSVREQITSWLTPLSVR